MQVAAGSLLVAHPARAHHEQRNSVVYVTESTHHSTMGLVLNNIRSQTSMQQLLETRGVDWPWNTPVQRGGNINPGALVMLHTDEWYSTNTMQTSKGLAISSDELMIQKLEMGNTPEWYRLFLGCTGWEPWELEQELRGESARWLLLPRPSWDTLTANPRSQWKQAVNECSQNVFNEYF